MSETTDVYGNVYDYILKEETAFKTIKVPVTNSYDWNMAEHIERCTNVANGWFHKGKNDGMRPYKNIVMPILNVGRRSEGFDVKDIEPYVNDQAEYHKSFLVRKYHPKWARRHNIDTFIDEMVDSSLIYDLVVVKEVNNVRPEVVKLQQIAFCDQTNFDSGPVCLKHQYSHAELLDMAGKWDADKVEEAVIMAKAQKPVAQAGDQVVKTPGKYIEVYELHGKLPEHWLDDDEYQGNPDKYEDQIQIITFYNTTDGKKKGICLFKKKEKVSPFKSFVVLPIFGRACGLSLVEQMFDPQVWTNYSEIKIKSMLDAAALTLLQTSDQTYATKNKVTEKDNLSIMTHAEGGEITQVNMQPQNLTHYTNHQLRLEENARTIGSARDAQLGISPTSGTPLGTTEIVTQEGQGIHEWRQGRIITFMTEIYRDWVMDYLVAEMNKGQKFLEELSVEEMTELANHVAAKKSNEWIRTRIQETGQPPSEEERMVRLEAEKQGFVKDGKQRFMEIMKDELRDLPTDVFINIKNKNKNMVQYADKLTNVIREVIANPDGFARVPGIAKTFNELLENSGLSPINFAEITAPRPKPVAPEVAPQQQTLTA